MKPKIYRQGDVLIEQVAKLPDGLKRQKPKHGRIVLAYGEATGHHHSLAAIDGADWWKAENGDQFLTIKKPAPVEHQEHAAIDLLPGKYRVRRQREYTPSEIRKVAD